MSNLTAGKWKAKFIFSAAVCAFIFCTTLWGQGTTAQISGAVKDSTGLAVPGADVKATQTATGVVRSSVSGPDGSFMLPNLAIGPYLVEFSKEGFSKYVQSGIVLQVDGSPLIEAVLKIGSVSEQVTVQADATLVDTRSSGVGTVVDNQRVAEMPLNGRNPTELIFLAGMATTGPTATGSLNGVRNYPTVTISVSGGVANQITFLLDGANHNDAYNNLNLPLPFPDALQEFKVETSALPAQYGQHASASVNAVTKSGTNQLHGDAFEFLRNGDLNARDFFAPSRDTIKRNQFGGTAGGRIIKDKLFFFQGYQATLQRSAPSQNTAYVPTPAELAGDFTTVTAPGCAGKQITLAANQGFVGNKIAPSLFNAAALKIAAKLPTSTTNSCGQVQFGLLSNSREDLGLSRIDYQKSERHSIFGRFYVANLDSPSTWDGKDLLTINTISLHDRVYSLALGDTFLIGSNMVNSFRISANRVAVPKPVDNVGTWQDFGVNAASLAGPTIRTAVTGSGFTIGGGNSVPTLSNTGPDPNVSEDLSLVKGAHQFAFGANYAFTQIVFRGAVNAVGTPTFNGSVAGLSMADFLIGQTQNWSQGNFNPYYNRQNYLGYYAQDTWKLTPRLTVNYGLRMEPYIAIYSKVGWFEHFDQGLFDQNVHSSVFLKGPAGTIFPGDPQWPNERSYNSNKWNIFQPRLGFAWDPKGDGKMIIRAAAGIFNDRSAFNSTSAMSQAPPFGSTISLNNVSLSNPWANYPGGNPLPIPIDKNVTFPQFGGYVTAPFDWKPTTVNQFNLSIQRQVGSDWLFTANYVANTTTHLFVGNELNQAVFLGLGACTLNGVNYPVCSTTANTNQRRLLYLKNPAQGQFYAVVADSTNGGTGSYNGLYVSAQKRLSHGVSVLANYTWSHCISDFWAYNPGQSATSVITPNNRRVDRGSCDASDQRQLFNASMVAQTPHFSNRAVRLLASDWQFSPILKLKSANLFNVLTGVDNALNGEGSQRPNLIANPYPENQSIDHWLVPTAFQSASPGQIGALARNSLKGPGVFQLDLALSRTFRLREKTTLQLRADFFNLPNHMNPAPPVASTNSGAFGQIQGDISGTSGLSAGDPRIIQMAVKVVF